MPRRFQLTPSVLALATVGCASLIGLLTTRRMGIQPDGSIIVPTGQTITPAGTHIEVNDRPLGMVLSPEGNQLVVVTGSNFAARRIHVIDVPAESITQSIPIGDSFVGVAFTSDGRTLYVGGGRDNNVKIYRRQEDETLRADGVVTIPASAPSGVSLSPTDETLYVALNLKHAVGIIDTKTRQVSELAVGIYPYTTVVTPDGEKVYVSNWGGRRPEPGDVTDGVVPVVVDPETGIAMTGTISVLDAKSRTVLTTIDVGLHPSAMVLSPDARRLYVANANSDTISVIDTEKDTVERTIDVRLFADAPLGSAPNALAVSTDGGTLYVANAANNAVAVVEPDRPGQPVLGFIPTGWFPTAVAVSADGRKLYVASGYGFGSIAPPPPGREGRSYTDRVGVVSILDVPDQKLLEEYTRQVLRNNGAPGGKEAAVGNEKARSLKKQPIPMNRGRKSPIQHVFYIIKENRTYDQLFGDLPQGDGDLSLVQFGRNVTPNHHALAEGYVLLDNFYTTGDQSALGHQWANEAYANDYVHKYGNARNDFAGTNPMAYASSGFLWDNARRHGKAVRVYGEFALNTITPPNATWSDIYRDWLEGREEVTITPRTRVAGLRDILAPRFPGFTMRVTEQRRVDEFLREFRQFEKDGNLPNLLILLLPIDHTNGTSPGFPTPRAMVADNDLALGRLVEAISHSRYWGESVLFVTEDDAQNGLDHVDGHRTVGLVISPYARREIVDSTRYTTISMFRTIEQILGLPPLNQYDLAAEPMFRSFTDEPDFSPYTALANQIPLDEMNPGLAGLTGLQKRLAQESLKMDFSEPDDAPENLLNRVIWHSVKGFQAPYPVRKRSNRALP